MMSISSQKGSALISVLFLSSLIGLTALYTFTALRLSSELNISESFSLSARAKATSGLMKNTLGGMFPATGDAYQLTEHTALSGKVSITREASIRINTAPSYILYSPILEDLAKSAVENVPLIDYNALFSGAVSCHAKKQKSLARTDSGFKLSSASSVNEWTCQVSGESSSQSFISNLFSSAPISFSSGVLSATGYIDIPSTLEVSGPLLIVSGGDLHIKEIKSAESAITLISATGRIQIDKVSGHPALKFISSAKVGSPVRPVSDNILYPPLLPGILLGTTAP